MTYTANDYFRHGVYFTQQGALEQAIREFTRAIQKDPKFVKAYIERGRIYRKRGFFDQAMADFNSALELEPGNEEVRSNLQAAVRFEPSEARPVRAGLQPGELSVSIGPADEDQALVASQPVGETDQNRREGGAERSLHHLPNGGGGGLQGCLRGNPGSDQPIAMLHGVIFLGILKAGGQVRPNVGFFEESY